MIVDQKQIDFFKKIASNQFALMVLNDYGHENHEKLLYLTDSISNIYKYLQYNSFKKVTIYISLHDNFKLSLLEGSKSTLYNSYENLTPLNGEDITLEIKENGSIEVSIDFNLNIEMVRQNAIIYQFDKQAEREIIYGKVDTKKLIPIPDADTYFSIQSYKELELALEDYKTKVAKHSECAILQSVWYDANMIFFKNGPEHRLRDSLTQFLKMRLRNCEVRPEQVVDKSHPVDIKVTWALANRLALIEIKWLGKSLLSRNKQFTKMYFDSRALSGASQLATYLDDNLKQSPTYASKGYLVVFDARRANSQTSTVNIERLNALKYANMEIQYNPQYNVLRGDFHKPFRFFMQPKYTN